MERLPTLAANLVRLDVDVIVATLNAIRSMSTKTNYQPYG
jgi:hypothetical protein